MPGGHHRRNSSSDGTPLLREAFLQCAQVTFGMIRAFVRHDGSGKPFTSICSERYEHPVFTAIAKVMSFFGAETFYILFLTSSLWTIDWRFGMLFGHLLAMSLTLGNVLKNVFLLPRPQSPPVHVHDIEHDWGLPSTHALNCVALGGYAWWYVFEHRVAWQISTTFLVSFGAGILIWAVGVMVSRLYLGLHSPIDLYIGSFVGALSLVAFAALDDILYTWVASTPLGGILFCILVITFHPRPYPTTSYYTSVVILGMAAGFYLAQADLVHHIFTRTTPTYSPFPFGIVRVVFGNLCIFLVKELEKAILFPLIHLFCRATNVPYVKHVAATIERQPSFTHLGVLNKLAGWYYVKRVQRSNSSSTKTKTPSTIIPIDPLIRQHETNMELIFAHRRYFINIDVLVKFCVYTGLPLAALYLQYLYGFLGI